MVLDTAPSKGTVATWFKELIPQGRHYVGLTPAAGAAYLDGRELGVNSARADLFRGGMFLVNAPYGTPGEAVKLATDLTELLGAKAMISDELEADGLVSFTHLLPELASAALIDATVNQPGWSEGRKIAARPYASVTAALVENDDARSLGEAALGNRESVMRVLDAYVASLLKLRDALDARDEKAVGEFLAGAVQARERWVNERTRADWQTLEAAEVQSFGDKLSHMFLGNIMERTKNKK